MAATERVVLQMTREQKAAVVAHAAKANVTLSDYIRQRALDDEEVLGAVLHELEESNNKTAALLDATIKRLRDAEKHYPALQRAAKARAKKEFAGVDASLFSAFLNGDAQ